MKRKLLTLLLITLLFGKQYASLNYNLNEIKLNDLTVEQLFDDRDMLERNRLQFCPCEEGKVCPTRGPCPPVATRKIYQSPGDAFSSPPVNVNQ